MALSTYFGNSILNMVFNNTAFTELATVYISYHSADPGLNGANEVTGNGYARVAVNAGGWDAVASKATQNTNSITFPTASGNQGNVTHVGVWDAASGGNFLWGAALTATVTVNSGNTPQFASGALDIALT